MPIVVALAAVMSMSVGLSSAEARTGTTQSGRNQSVQPAGSAYVWSLTNVVCYYSGGANGWGGVTGHAYIRENGTSGTTWFRMTARFQRKSGGRWITTKSKYVQSAQRFPNNSAWHSLDWNPIKFYNTHTDYTHFTRLFVLFEWFHNNNRIYWATRWSGSC
jgi:hypothetical protein